MTHGTRKVATRSVGTGALLLVAALAAAPTAGDAQSTVGYSWGIGLAAGVHSAPGPGFAATRVSVPSAWPRHRPATMAYLLHVPARPYHWCVDRSPYHWNWGPHGCWDCSWYDPYDPCYWIMHRTWWVSLGFLGWPSPRWHSHGPFVYGGSYPPSFFGYGDHYHYTYTYYTDRYEGRRGGRGGYATPGGYRASGKARSRGGHRERVARGSPLFGPRYKEPGVAKGKKKDGARSGRRSGGGSDSRASAPRGSRADLGPSGYRGPRRPHPDAGEARPGRSGERGSAGRGAPRGPRGEARTDRRPRSGAARTGSTATRRRPEAKPATRANSLPAVKRSAPKQRATAEASNSKRRATAKSGSSKGRATAKSRPRASKRSPPKAKSSSRSSSTSKAGSRRTRRR